MEKRQDEINSYLEQNLNKLRNLYVSSHEDDNITCCTRCSKGFENERKS